MATTEADGVPPQPIADNLCGAEPHSFLSLLGSGGSAPHIFGRHIHIGLHELRGHQFYCMPKGSQLPGPMVRAATGLHTDQTGCKVSEKCKDLGPLEGLPEDYLAPAIHPMNRKNGLCEIHSYRCNLPCRLLPVSGMSHTPLWHF